jgi:hypothetical protein
MAEIEENKTGDGPSAKDTLREVLRDTISMAVGEGLSIQEFRGIALFNVERDEKITALGSFSDAIAKITDLP